MKLCKLKKVGRGSVIFFCFITEIIFVFFHRRVIFVCITEVILFLFHRFVIERGGGGMPWKV